jgi:hypothetical protein
MSYTEDLQKLARLEKLRIISLIVAFTCSFASLAFDLTWLNWPRAFGWIAGGAVAIMEARCEKRLGRDADGSYLRAILFFIIGATCFYWAAK